MEMRRAQEIEEYLGVMLKSLCPLLQSQYVNAIEIILSFFIY